MQKVSKRAERCHKWQKSVRKIQEGSLYQCSPFSSQSLKHHHCQTLKARELKYLDDVHPPPRIPCHMSNVTCHLSRVTCRVSQNSNSNYDKTQKHKLWKNSKTQIVTKLKNSNCYQNQKLKLWEKLKSKTLTTQKLKVGQNSKTQNVTILKNSNCDKTQKLKLWQNLKKIDSKLNVEFLTLSYGFFDFFLHPKFSFWIL